VKLPGLPPSAFSRDDESPDAIFYSQPRFVTHIDDGAIAAVTQLYREFLPVGGAVLDLMSSWISHLPPEIKYSRVAGLGMNREELAANPRLDHFVVQDLNANPKLPFESASFDAATICVSIDYLIDPVAVLRELARVVKRDGPVLITFSNRCFPSKVIRAWLATDDAGRVAIVKKLLTETGTWRDIQTLDRSPGRGDPLFCVFARSGGES
jgi:SAM-dependent methyltransferase